MPTCPACGSEVAAESKQCPECHLSVTLFSAVREAAGTSPNQDPTYIRTIGELLATVDLGKPGDVPPEVSSHGLMSRPKRSATSGGPPPEHRGPRKRSLR